jgi:hypothetical protein
MNQCHWRILGGSMGRTYSWSSSATIVWKIYHVYGATRFNEPLMGKMKILCVAVNAHRLYEAAYLHELQRVREMKKTINEESTWAAKGRRGGGEKAINEERLHRLESTVHIPNEQHAPINAVVDDLHVLWITFVCYELFSCIVDDLKCIVYNCDL